MGIWKAVQSRLEKWNHGWAALSKNLAIFAVAGTVIGYWTSHSQETARRHDSAWANLRAAIVWTQGGSDRWGNVGQIAAIETLTQDCDGWWRGTIVASVMNFIFPDCVPLKSVALERMELGGLQVAGADLSYSNLACTNLTTANLRNAKLQGASFRGAELAWADLRGATLDSLRDLRLANLTRIKTDGKTSFDLNALKCACVNFRRSEDRKSEVPDIDDSPDANVEITNLLRLLKPCPGQHDRCDEPVVKAWKCLGEQ